MASIALCVAAAGPAAADANADFKAANAAYDSGKFAEAERISTELLKADLSKAGRVSVLILRGIARNAQGKYAASVVDLAKALPLADKANKGIIRFDRMLPLLSLEKFDDAYKDLLAMAQSYPTVVKDVTMRNVFAVGRHLLKNERHDDLLTLLLALKKTGYRGPDSLATTDYLYIYLVQELADHHRADEAAPLIAEFTEYDVLLEVRTGRRYAALWATPTVAPLLQPQDFPARQLAAAQKMLAQHAKNLKAAVHLIAALRLNGRYADAVALAQGALKTPSPYDKDAEYELWLKNELAYALQAQGQFAQATAALDPLLKKNAKDDSNLVNQFINLGTMYLEQGRYSEAIAAAGKAHGFSSGYGEKYIQYITACAKFRTGKTSEAETALLDILNKPEDSYGAVTDTLLCLKKEDQAAAIVLKRLNDKGEQSQMLNMLQDCRENPKRPPLARDLHAALMRIRERPEIKAAIAPLGVILNQPIACGDRDLE